MATANPFLNQEETAKWTNLVEASPLKDKIRLFPRFPTHEKIAELMSYSDCGLYPSRGEGWNLELLEHMAMDKPVTLPTGQHIRSSVTVKMLDL